MEEIVLEPMITHVKSTHAQLKHVKINTGYAIV